MVTVETKLLAYTTLIRLKLEHATVVSNPHQKYPIDGLVQNRATGFILKTYSLVSVTQLKYFVDSLALKGGKITSHHLLALSPNTPT